MSINREEIHNELTAIKALLTQGLSGVELERNLLVYKALVLSLNLSLNSIPAESDVVPGEQIQSDWTQTDNTLKDFIKNKPTTFTPTAHTHDDRYYTETEIDLALSSKSNTGHTHTSSNITDFQTTVSLNSDVVANTTARHTHSNKTILDAITEAFTVTLKTAYDSTVTWISTNGSNLINHLTNTSNPHSVTKTQVGLANVANVDTTTTANITDSLNKRFITDAKKTVLDNTSNTNTGDETTASIQTKRPLKTVNGESLEGAGNVVIAGSGIADAPNDANAYVRSGLAWVVGYTKATIDTLLSGKAASSHTHTKSQITDFSHTHPQSEITNLVTDLGNKQATLVSGTNIKTINGESLLGSGNISISGGALSYEEAILGTDVVMSTSNLFYDVVSVSLSAGTWLLNAHLTQVRGATTAETIVARLTNKTTNFASQQMYHPSASGAGVALSITKVLVLASPTTIFLQCATNSGNANSRVEAATTVNTSGNNATILTAVKII
jgi:hypothetical protein